MFAGQFYLLEYTFCTVLVRLLVLVGFLFSGYEDDTKLLLLNSSNVSRLYKFKQ